MFLTIIDCELWTTIYLFRRAVVGLLDNSLPSFPDLIQPLPWALPELSVSNDIVSILSTGTTFIRRFPPTILRDVTLTTAIKIAQNRLYTGDGEFRLEHLLAVWPNLLHLLHLKGGPLAGEGDHSFTERIAFYSSSEISIT